MSKLGAFYASKLGGFIESSLHARDTGASTDPCPTYANLTLAGVDASTPCTNRLLGLGPSCSSPYYCVSGVTTAVDGTYHIPRFRGPTTDGWCEFRGEFDADSEFLQRTFVSLFLGVPTCSDPSTTRTSTRIRIYVRVNREVVREVWVWSIENGVAAIPISFFNGYLSSIGYDDTGTFDNCDAATCGRLMSGGTFVLARSS